MGEKKGNTRGINEQEFRIWNNSRFFALEDEDGCEDTEILSDERVEGLAGTKLQGKGKRPHVQISEAQIIKNKMTRNEAS